MQQGHFGLSSLRLSSAGLQHKLNISLTTLKMKMKTVLSIVKVLWMQLWPIYFSWIWLWIHSSTLSLLKNFRRILREPCRCWSVLLRLLVVVVNYGYFRVAAPAFLSSSMTLTLQGTTMEMFLWFIITNAGKQLIDLQVWKLDTIMLFRKELCTRKRNKWVLYKTIPNTEKKKSFEVGTIHLESFLRQVFWTLFL